MAWRFESLGEEVLLSTCESQKILNNFYTTSFSSKQLIDSNFMAQSLSNLLIHLVFSTKHRAPLIHNDMQSELYILMKGISRSMNSPAIEVGGTEDHVHLLLVLPRTGMISDIVRNLKSFSSRWANEKDPTQKLFGWQRGYAAFSVSYSTRSKVIEYIRMQKKLHENRSFQDEYRLILKMHEVHFDENSVWD